MNATTYIALLRGINVNGQKLIKMDHLKSIFESMPVSRVRTYIQSGNVLFEVEDRGTDQIRESIESKLKDALGYKVDVVVRTKDELELTVADNPFEEDGAPDDGKIYVSFLSEKPTAEALRVLASFQSDVDEYRVAGREVYIRCRGQYGKSLFSNNFLEKKLGVIATTRNWQTVNKLVSMAGE
ncbi:DUF1697 domain-containing protein [Paenibacillus mesophilus]|uniref:DUF1697 domain-containing protein n=1 Tax=Paenibacillus mesophilus TaxID=2582849 RepID=UPI00110DC338|nr:DUF1697 domain-containing protein [Paenibacillus mesophilus]TMV50762.1 DUF1697 domain-containing protein [Paenibacillus mesophilus]